MAESEIFEASIPDEWAGERVDHALARLFPDYSRSRLQSWLKEGQILLDGQVWRAKDKVLGGEQVELQVVLSSENHWEAENIPLNIIFEDEQLIVINKPAGMVVHPAAGNYSATMLNALLFYAPELEAIPRAGIVHRLDKDTSGLLVVARTLQSQKSLVEQLQARSFLREYDAIVQGVMTAGGTIEQPIGRHPVNRKRMAVNPNGKPAITHYRVNERYRL
ncbi:MAG: RluA family pseudouridine synthase, partial [Gammaproteobacteria bacterium]|nr:RluA family pseudouridine synthase [Gammaproteobacteria bacterium]